MSTKKYIEPVLQRYYYWKLNGGTAAEFCQMEGLDRANLSAAHTAWKKRKGIK